MKPHRGTLILVLGILGFVVCGFFTGIPAWYMGHTDIKEMDAGMMDPSGRGITNAGKICGIISSVLSVITLIVFAILLVVFYDVIVNVIVNR